jgi:O-antigen/teichoic acid export membrane protein
MFRLPSDRRLLMNIAFIYTLQVSNYFFGYVSTPYLTRMLGVASYGSLSYCVSTNAYLWMLLDWGFGVGAVRQVAAARGDPAALGVIFWRTIGGRVLLAVPAVVLLLLAYAARPQLPIVLVSGGLTILGGVLASDWFVQGLERMGLYLITSVASRGLTLLLIVLLVRGPADMPIASVVQGLNGLLGGASGFILVLACYRLGAPRVRWRLAAREAWDFRHYFVARSTSILYVSAPAIVLGIVSTAVAMGTFAGADKIARIAVTLVGPLSVALTPRVFALMAASKDRAGQVSGRFVLIQLAITLMISAGLFCLARPIADLVLGRAFADSAAIIRILSPLPVLIGLNGALGNQFLVPLNLARELSRANVTAGALYLGLLIVLSHALGATGAAWALIGSEVLLNAMLLNVLLSKERAHLLKAFGLAAR